MYLPGWQKEMEKKTDVIEEGKLWKETQKEPEEIP